MFSKVIQQAVIVTEHTISRNISTSSIHLKKTPHTIGVMSWVRAGRRRKYLERQMRNKPKQEHEIVKEKKLDRMDPEIEFLTTSRVSTRMNERVMSQQLIEPTVFFSKDRETILCYHPPPRPYPEHFTKRATAPKAIKNDTLYNGFKSSMTSEEITEASALRKKDPTLWNITSLSVLFQVKPDTINEYVPLSCDLSSTARAEKELFQGMSVGNRKKFAELQRWERLKYVRQTRGPQFVDWFKNFNKPSKIKVPVPPKF